MKSFIKTIEEKICKKIKLKKINIIDNSQKHKGHKSFKKNNFHLKIIIESDYLKSLSRIDSQRLIMKTLNEEMKSKIHAIEIEIN